MVLTGSNEYSGFKRLFRKQLILPAEHGTWAWFLVPYLAGVFVAGRLNVAGLLVLIGGLSAFLMRQPVTRWLRVRQGKGRRADGSLAAGWTLALGALAMAALVLLLILGVWPILWLLPPMAIILGVYLLLALRPGSSVRTLYMELAGAAGLAGAAPAAYIAGTGRVNGVAAWLWILFAAQNVLGALYVRLRIADTHERPMSRRAVLLAHFIILICLASGVLIGNLSWVALIPFIAFTFRAEWVAVRPRPVANIKRFGFAEVLVEVMGGLVYVIALI